MSKPGSIYINSIVNLDCAIFHQEQGIKGHSWSVDATVEGFINDNGFIFDFAELKHLVKDLISKFDHVLFVPKNNSGVKHSSDNNQEYWEMITSDNFAWIYSCPKGATVSLDSDIVNVQTIENTLTKLLKQLLPANISSCKISLHEEIPTSSDDHNFFQYTHGLCSYPGLCQRPFHGHRSKIYVYYENQRSKELEQFLLQNIHRLLFPAF